MLQAPDVAQCLLICAAFSFCRVSPVPAAAAETKKRGEPVQQGHGGRWVAAEGVALRGDAPRNGRHQWGHTDSVGARADAPKSPNVMKSYVAAAASSADARAMVARMVALQMGSE